MYATTLGVAIMIAYFLFYKQPFVPPDEKESSATYRANLNSRRGYLNLVFIRHAECMHTAAIGTPSAVSGAVSCARWLGRVHASNQQRHTTRHDTTRHGTARHDTRKHALTHAPTHSPRSS